MLLINFQRGRPPTMFADEYNPVLEQAKQYYKAGRYDRSIQLIEYNHAQIPEKEKHIFSDILGCSYFLLNDYEKAAESFNTSIIYDTANCDYFISKAATLIKLENKEGAQQMLKGVEEYVSYPSLYYNFTLIYPRNSEQFARNYRLFEKYKHLSPYFNTSGLQPSFLKKKSENPTYVFNQDNKFITDFTVKDSEGLSYQQIVEHFHKFKKFISDRRQLKTQKGILCPAKIKSIIITDVIIQECNTFQKQKYNLQRQIQPIKEQIKNIFIKIMTASTIDDLDLLVNNVSELAKKVQKYKKKEINFYNRLEQYQAQIGKINDGISYQILNGKIKMVVKDVNLYFYCSEDFKRSITPQKLMNGLQDKGADIKKFYFNFYWAILMKIIFNSKQYDSGFNWDQFILFKQIFSYFYQQFAPPDTQVSEIQKTIEVIIDKLERFLKLQFLRGSQKHQILQNFGKLTSYLEEIDQAMANIFSNNKNINFFYEKPVSEHANFFRHQFSLDDSFQDQLAESFIVFCYHLRNPINQKGHKLLQYSFKDIINQQKQELNGRDSMIENFYRFSKPSTFLGAIMGTIKGIFTDS